MLILVLTVLIKKPRFHPAVQFRSVSKIKKKTKTFILAFLSSKVVDGAKRTTPAFLFCPYPSAEVPRTLIQH